MYFFTIRFYAPSDIVHFVLILACAWGFLFTFVSHLGYQNNLSKSRNSRKKKERAEFRDEAAVYKWQTWIMASITVTVVLFFLDGAYPHAMLSRALDVSLYLTIGILCIGTYIAIFGQGRPF